MNLGAGRADPQNSDCDNFRFVGMLGILAGVMLMPRTRAKFEQGPRQNEVQLMAKRRPHWDARPTSDDYGAAASYLSLQFPIGKARSLVRKARGAKATEHVAKDILRACHLPLLPTDEQRVAENLKRIHKGKPLSPIILIQGDLTRGRPFVIADGYHRMCAACHANEDAPVRGILVPAL